MTTAVAVAVPAPAAATLIHIFTRSISDISVNHSLSLSLCFFAAVRFGRVPKREKARILAAMQQSTQNRGQQRALATELDDQPRLLAAVLRAHLETCEFTKEKVSAMRQRARECPSYSMPTLLVSKPKQPRPPS